MKYLFRKDLQQKKIPSVNVPHKKTMLCLNESALDPYQVVKNDFLQMLENIRLNRYFSDIGGELRKSLAAYAGVNEDAVIWGNGADDLLYSVFTAVNDKNGGYALALAPSYFDYKTYSAAVGLEMQFQDFSLQNGKFVFDCQAYVRKAQEEDCRLAILCNPNNPTGHLLTDAEVLFVLENITDKPVLLDETYFEFSGKTYVHFLQKYPHLLIVRSFSKAFSAAGLRFGYLLGSAANCLEIKKVMKFFHNSILVEAFAFSVLKNKAIFLQYNDEIVRQREIMYQAMQQLTTVKVFPSATNFLIFSLEEKSAEFFSYLANHEISVREVGGHPLLKNYLRVTVSNGEDNQRFLTCLKNFLQKEKEKKILILCTGNSCRSQMAEAFLNTQKGIKASSAGTHPAKEIDLSAIAVMQELGIGIKNQKPKHLQQFMHDDFDYVITVCDHAREECPLFLGSVKQRVHFGFEDPHAHSIEKFREVRDKIIATFTSWLETIEH